MRSMVFGWVSRRKTALWGALVLVFAMVGTAGATAGAMLHLGVLNTSGATTTLRSGVNGAVLQVTNTNTSGTGVRGLGITVPTGRAPISVSSGAGKAANLNADKVDGKNAADFLAVNGKAAGLRTIYYTGGSSVNGVAGEYQYLEDACPAGMLPVGGSFSSMDGMITPVHFDFGDANFDGKPDGWGVAAYFDAADTLFVFATCVPATTAVVETSTAAGTTTERFTRAERLDGIRNSR